MSIKDSNPNMLDISSAGYLSASPSGTIRELKEESNIDITVYKKKF